MANPEHDVALLGELQRAVAARRGALHGDYARGLLQRCLDLLTKPGMPLWYARFTGDTPAARECARWGCDGDHKYYSHDPETGALVAWDEEEV